jgi:hypothetical protein
MPMMRSYVMNANKDMLLNETFEFLLVYLERLERVQRVSSELFRMP